MERGLRLLYQAVEKGDVDAIVAYSSDGRIAAMDLKGPEDDKSFFPPYDAMLIVRQETLVEYPKLSDALDRRSGRIDQGRSSGQMPEWTWMGLNQPLWPKTCPKNRG